MLLYRILSAIVGIPIIIAAIWYGGVLLFSLIGILILLGLNEYYNIMQKMHLNVYPGIGYVGGILILLTAYLNSAILETMITIMVIALLTFTVFKFKESNFQGLSATLVGIFYVGLFFSYLLLLREISNGFYLLLYLFVLNWTSDTAAYFVGRAFGKSKLAPQVSPNKTIEGSLGGILGSIIISIIFGLHFLDFSFNHLIFIGVIVSVFGQFGDLIESALKRMADVKDSGNLIPGHGGVLDRFDSILLTAPLLYFYLMLFSLV